MFDFYFVSQIDFISECSKALQNQLKLKTMLIIDDEVKTNLIRMKEILLEIYQLSELMYLQSV
jgi:hypothetical protein